MVCVLLHQRNDELEIQNNEILMDFFKIKIKIVEKARRENLKHQL